MTALFEGGGGAKVRTFKSQNESDTGGRVSRWSCCFAIHRSGTLRGLVYTWAFASVNRMRQKLVVGGNAIGLLPRRRCSNNPIGGAHNQSPGRGRARRSPSVDGFTKD